MVSETTTTVTVRIPEKTKAKLDRLAEVTRRSRSFLAADAINAYAEAELAIVEDILRGQDDARAGRVVPHDQAMAELHARIDKVATRRKRRSA
jgi:predicted transcriptional regulator